jgi:hypothetical protein
MATVSGKDGKISIKSGSGAEQFITYVTSWDFESSMDIEEAAYFGGALTEEGTKEKTPGATSWTGSVAGAVDSAEISNQSAFFNAHNNALVVSVMFYLNGTIGYTGEAYVESVNVTHSADGKAEFTASLSGNGKINQIDIN